jgi:hypothetical protein
VQALRLLAEAVADASIERLQEVQWDAKDRWGDTPLQVRGVHGVPVDLPRFFDLRSVSCDDPSLHVAV